MPTGSEDILQGRWYAGLEEYDYLQSAEFGPGGEGELVYGHGQAVKFQGRFRYTVEGAGRLRLALEGGEAGPPRVLGFEVADGPFPVRLSPARTRLARRLLRFEADPFPAPWPGGDLPRDYYQW